MSLQMNDYAYKDRRSIHAMLNGYGDGRERLWMDYAISRKVNEAEMLINLHHYAAVAEDFSIYAKHATRRSPIWFIRDFFDSLFNRYNSR